MRRARRLVCGRVLAVLALLAWSTGCTNQGSEITPSTSATNPVSTSAATPTGTTTSPTASGATSPTATGPTAASSSVAGVPTAAQVDSADGAVAFVRFVVGEVNRAYLAGDDRVLGARFSSGCKGCADLTRDLAETMRRKQHVSADIWTIRTAMVNTWEPGTATVALVVDQNKVDYLDELSRRVDTAEQGTFRYLLTLERSGSSWIVGRWQQVSQ